MITLHRKGWHAEEVDDLNVHVWPCLDLIVHELTDDCICGPKTRPVEHEDGTISWIVAHESLDRREDREGEPLTITINLTVVAAVLASTAGAWRAWRWLR